MPPAPEVLAAEELATDALAVLPPSVPASAPQVGSGFGAWTQPFEGSHASTVQKSLSVQSMAGPGTHTPKAQESGAVQMSPSSQLDVLNACTQPAWGSHESSVHSLPS